MSGMSSGRKLIQESLKGAMASMNKNHLNLKCNHYETFFETILEPEDDFIELPSGFFFF